MALDVGDRRIGVAVSDPLRLFSIPLVVMDRRGEERDVAAVLELALEHEAAVLIVGLPLLPSGDRGEQARKAEAFARALLRAGAARVELWDESYSTLEAAARRVARGRAARPRPPGGARAAAPLDAEAAAVILEEWLRAHEEAPAEAAPDVGAVGGGDAGGS